ncbi:Gfo/Idh/MocA family protein [Haloferula sp.]|uniref:Gfo/Idh/MocA family protein n=1 Tax=Haloferula sp. TaxID=2497595 RepID=UPI00329E466F
MRDRSRRQFIATTTAASLLPRFAAGKSGASANGKLNLAVVGAGGMGGYAVSVARTENFVALCDVDEARASKAIEKNSGVPFFRDFRVMLDKMGKEIDAVLISTPDHTHFPIAMAAMEMGKHVFVQKPLAHNIWECRTLQKAAAHYKVITQMGNQGHNFGGMHRIKEWVDAGVIGDVSEVITWTNRPNKPYFVPPSSYPPKNGPVPDTLDWDLWQGPVARRPYSKDYVPIRWRGWWDYGCGSLGDIGCHTFDAPFWVLNLGMPTKVEVEQDDPPGDGFITMSSLVTYYFPARDGKPPVTLKWYEKGRDAPKPKRWDEADSLDGEGGMYMEGTKETLYHAGMRPTSPTLTPKARFMEKRKMLSEIERMAKTPGPIEQWVAAIKGEGPMPGSSFDYAAKLTEMVLLGAMAQRTGKTIEWDPVKMQVKGHPEFASLIKEPTLKGWEYGENLWK